MPQVGYVNAALPGSEKQVPLNAVMEQTNGLLAQAWDSIRNLNNRLMPVPEVPQQGKASTPSGLIGQANESRNLAQRINEELARLSEQL